MRRFFAIVLALIIITATVLPLSATEPSDARLAQVTAAVRNAVGKDTPGAAVVLLEGDTRLLFEGYGYADIEARSLITVESSFELGEISSLFVALAVQELVDRQMLELDRDIAYYLPGDLTKKLDLSYALTLNDLLSGRSGFSDRYVDLRYEDASLVFETLEEALLAKVPEQTRKPGISYAYSAFGITLAAYVVECVSGSDYQTFVTENILTPLGMTHTVLAPHRITPEAMTSGHVDKGEGSFALASEMGRTYSALWPADGAVSNAVDLALLLRHLMERDGAQAVLSAFENGVFQTGMAGLCVSGAARAITASTAHFTASLCFDTASGRAAVVLCNTASSVLTEVAYDYCNFVKGVSGLGVDGELPDPSQFEGEYVLLSKMSADIYGRETQNVTAGVEEDGTLLFGTWKLVQIAPGIFAHVDAPEIAVLQFLMDIEGEVSGVMTADGAQYRLADFAEEELVSDALFILLIVGAAYLLLSGIFAFLDALISRAREVERPRAWRFTIPWMFAAMNAIVVILQVLVCRSFGGATIASFQTAVNTVALVATIGGTCTAAYALLTGFTVQGMTWRVARNGIIYVLFLMLSGYWGLSLL